MRYVVASIFLITSALFSFAQEAQVEGPVETEIHVGTGSTVMIPGPDAPGASGTDFGQLPDTVHEANPETTVIVPDPVPLDLSE
ncbi:hypothetical protein GOB13_21735 [Sinorhizobium meliloti]|uniref:hypothetical protein n=1 Tax=Rhizobium meliloti TaxID=382 RepID=UPI000B49C40E|nr:hypothetical protein [Sinorhizobium meliloti]ASQ04091.1 hypothetical protein CDO23_09150 [Sinorhizobium meliloti]MDW9519684.1 hypothetical protein [Sinorhizobium meliloti]MDW9634149.1 hypothetical protein [Sinorhizobium meliloti]MDW9844642.1 hypothetical protein [Sinorhizobium meliloti]MDX0008829.1 hypothetical protein [Sinorhizobium meliloti]